MLCRERKLVLMGFAFRSVLPVEQGRMHSMNSIDALDARILLALDDEPDASTLALARTLGISRNTVHARLQRLHRGPLRGFSQRVSPAMLGYGMVAFVSLAISQSVAANASALLEKIPEVVEIHSTTGDSDLLLKVVARDTSDLHRVTGEILAIDGIVRSSTVISLAETMPNRTRALLERVAQQ